MASSKVLMSMPVMAAASSTERGATPSVAFSLTTVIFGFWRRGLASSFVGAAASSRLMASSSPSGISALYAPRCTRSILRLLAGRLPVTALMGVREFSYMLGSYWACI